MNVLFKTKPDLPRAFLLFEVGNIFLLNYYTSAYFSILKQLMYTIEGVSKISVPLKQAISLSFSPGNRLVFGELESADSLDGML